MTPHDVTLCDQNDQDWSLAAQLDAGLVMVTLRGDWWPYCNSQLVSLALRYDEFLGAGVRIVGVSVDSPGQHAAMIEKLQLPFALVSDPAGTLLAQLDAFNPDERGGIGRPGTFVYDTDGVLRFHQVGRDFADRITEDELVREALALELPATEQPTLEHVAPEPGDTAMPVRALLPYCRGAKFAAKAMGLRHPSAAEDSTRYVAQMDRYMEAVRELRARSSH